MRTVRYLLIAVVVLALSGCNNYEPVGSPPQVPETAQTLPDGSTPTAAQSAYLDAVTPSLTSENAADVLKVLSSGENGVCDVWTHPAQSQGTAVQMLMESSGYNQTEATAIARAASEHLCPEKG